MPFTPSALKHHACASQREDYSQEFRSRVCVACSMTNQSRLGCVAGLAHIRLICGCVLLLSSWNVHQFIANSEKICIWQLRCSRTTLNKIVMYFGYPRSSSDDTTNNILIDIIVSDVVLLSNSGKTMRYASGYNGMRVCK